MITSGYSAFRQAYWYRKDIVFMHFAQYRTKGGVCGMAKFVIEAKSAMKKVRKKGSKRFLRRV